MRFRNTQLTPLTTQLCSDVTINSLLLTISWEIILKESWIVYSILLLSTYQKYLSKNCVITIILSL